MTGAGFVTPSCITSQAQVVPIAPPPNRKRTCAGFSRPRAADLALPTVPVPPVFHLWRACGKPLLRLRFRAADECPQARSERSFRRRRQQSLLRRFGGRLRTRMPKVNMEVLDLLDEELDRPPGRAHLVARIAAQSVAPLPQGLELVFVQPVRGVRLRARAYAQILPRATAPRDVPGIPLENLG